MTTLNQNTKFSKDDRYELASQAESQMRQNHPSHLVVLGGLVLAVSLIVLLIAWRSDAKAYTKLSNKAFQFGAIKAELATLTALESQSASIQRNAEFDKISDMRTRQESIASSVGLQASLGLPKTSSVQQSDAMKNSYTYTVTDASLEHILAWIQAATEQIPGLAISKIKIEPTTKLWKVEVVLYRYERIE